MKESKKPSLRKTDDNLAEKLRNLGPEFVDVAARLEAILKADDGKFRIVNAGMMNPGKSTLLNALIGRPEVFKTADVRETTEVKSVEWGSDVILSDTPGFSSAIIEDDSVALSALRSADLILFVHNIATGGINKAELDILVELKEIIGEAEFASRVLLLNTRSDECPNDAVLKTNCKECDVLIEENLGVKLVSYAISPKLYLDGMACDLSGHKEDGLVLKKESGIAKLIRALRTYVKNGSSRRTSALRSTIEELNGIYRTDTERLSAKKFDLKQKQAELRNQWKQTLEFIRPYWEECRK